MALSLDNLKNKIKKQAGSNKVEYTYNIPKLKSCIGLVEKKLQDPNISEQTKGKLETMLFRYNKAQNLILQYYNKAKTICPATVIGQRNTLTVMNIVGRDNFSRDNAKAMPGYNLADLLGDSKGLAVGICATAGVLTVANMISAGVGGKSMGTYVIKGLVELFKKAGSPYLKAIMGAGMAITAVAGVALLVPKVQKFGQKIQRNKLAVQQVNNETMEEASKDEGLAWGLTGMKQDADGNFHEWTDDDFEQLEINDDVITELEDLLTSTGSNLTPIQKANLRNNLNKFKQYASTKENKSKEAKNIKKAKQNILKGCNRLIRSTNFKDDPDYENNIARIYHDNQLVKLKDDKDEAKQKLDDKHKELCEFVNKEVLPEFKEEYCKRFNKIIDMTGGPFDSLTADQKTSNKEKFKKNLDKLFENENMTQTMLDMITSFESDKVTIDNSKFNEIWFNHHNDLMKGLTTDRSKTDTHTNLSTGMSAIGVPNLEITPNPGKSFDNTKYDNLQNDMNNLTNDYSTKESDYNTENARDEASILSDSTYKASAKAELGDNIEYIIMLHPEMRKAVIKATNDNHLTKEQIKEVINEIIRDVNMKTASEFLSESEKGSV